MVTIKSIKMEELVLEVGEEMKASQLDAMLDAATGREQKQREFVQKESLKRLD